ncbi:MAG: hypothetical protein IKO73_00230 [Bacteroidaceae bacterium]|nr:hypothetical protein [Bacteroidaceae bacterium]
MKHIFLFIAILAAFTLQAKENRWVVNDNHSVQWEISKGELPYTDHIEMSGLRASVVYYWGVTAQKQFTMDRHLVFPMLRTIPNNTHASWMPRCDVDFLKGMTANKRYMSQEEVKKVTIDGILNVFSTIKGDGNEFELTRQYFPTTTSAAVCEIYTIKNIGKKKETIRVPALYQVRTTNKEDGTRGSYKLVARTEFKEDLMKTLEPGDSVSFDCSIQAYAEKDEKEKDIILSKLECGFRWMFVTKVADNNLQFSCPDKTIETLFQMSKIRASESIFATQNGLMHAPGGESYYAAMWCNDQAEYVNPFFPFLGYDKGNESAMTTWRCYLKHINLEYKFVPWSIICGGDDVFGPFDRGDAAMLAYGASRYCLERGDKEIAQEVWPLIEWCLEYCHRKLNQHGVVASDADELEGRLPAGDANLCTSSLYYDALISAAYLWDEFKSSKVQGFKSMSDAATYRKQAKTLRENIDKFFHATVEGYDTYRYYEGNDVLRSWICIPLTMGIYDRAEGTLEAMFSPQLWTENGMLSQSGDKIFWDRSTLYGFRGAFAAGYADKALEYLKKFSAIRLLGEHVPYVVEAWPEGGLRHLSAESGLYCRIITEGLLGFRPTGFRSFTLTPQMPSEWNEYSLCNIYACTEQPFNIFVERTADGKLSVKIEKDKKIIKTYKIKPGEKIKVPV